MRPRWTAIVTWSWYEVVVRLWMAVVVVALVGGCRSEAGSSGASADAPKPAVGDRQALETWLACGTGISTASVVTCEMVHDWEKAQAVGQEEALLFGRCHGMVKGAKAAKSQWMIAKRGADGVSAALMKASDEQRRVFERLSRVVDQGIAKPKGEDVDSVEALVPQLKMQALEGAKLREKGDHVLFIDVDAEPTTIRLCRLATLASLRAKAKP